MTSPIIALGIESSCDECSISVVEAHSNNIESLKVLSTATYSQIKIHEPYGGVVPEIASRNHLETLHPMLNKAMNEAKIQYSDIDVIATTNRPGLVGSLLVGVTAGKSLAYALNKPLIPVHHLEGHILSLWLDQSFEQKPEFPMLIAVISGGHTNLYLSTTPPHQWDEKFLKNQLIGSSIDDAAGEAFDKTAKLLGFPYPGGIWIDQTAQNGDPNKYSFPRALPQKNHLNYSFSGLKTAVHQTLKKMNSDEIDRELPHLCASIQEAIIEAVWKKMKLGLEKNHCRSLGIVGGVAANSRLRSLLAQECKVPIYFPKKEYCTDNAAMIAAAGLNRYFQGYRLSKEESLTLNAVASPEY
ncbi:MAG: tRNA (adenosine(37)-N6)-threonylcarbamoyltransferase complex transferase subunit TsaD [Bdellovibrionaceae bacterium]|nr:tRNA (adenosine(37)-N6)-threonylcarbamoyltransferase complex transferase subunit TsaD [Pseudobdellovibrionaceae bacterium]|tara:strand:+ start:1062 stop:2129 length:1068 start_codon:yes stop_codon:yes gene_type:complete